jgi:predicted DNA-binding transcriptional regulator AlpA
MSKQLYRTKELTELLGISRGALCNWTLSGHFPKPIKLGSRTIAWSESDAEGWITEQQERTSKVRIRNGTPLLFTADASHLFDCCPLLNGGWS